MSVRLPDNANTDPRDVLAWVEKQYPATAFATSSFQTQSLPLLHMIAETVPNMPIVFIDTGFHFPETLAFRDQIVERFDLRLVNVTPAVGRNAFLKRYGELYESDPDACCHINKVSPLTAMIKDFRAWVTGVRRDQTATRQQLKILDETPQNFVRIAPLINWDAQRIRDYVVENQLPKHPLDEHGYRSIGCWPCTRAISAEEVERAGRWSNLRKTECGLHDNFWNKNS